MKRGAQPNQLFRLTGRVLATVVKTPDAEIDEYRQVLAEMAEASGGGITDTP